MDESPTTSRIFAYGTLAAEAVMRVLLGRVPPAAPARLEGYARYRVRGRVYPGIVAEPGAHTDGVVYEGLDAAGLALLDRFEGSLYRRESLRVRSASGVGLVAETYVVADSQRHALSAEPWSLERFVESHLADYVRALQP
jgi:gamma-glutamylcyclotransferase (GGCT)/AIG2-like uncharacterized protein YtfP